MFHVVDPDVEFSSGRAGQTDASRDTIAIRRHRHIPVKLHRLRWEISGRRA